MSRNDSDWEKKLGDKPHKEKGFSDDLRRRIEHQVERREIRRRRWLLPAAGLCGIAGGLTLYFFSGLSFLSERSVHTGLVASLTPAAAVTFPDDTPAAGALTGSPEEVNVKSGLLIGLRQDAAEDAVNGTTPLNGSTYRTLMLAPVDGQLRVAAQGNGILVPYGQKFWKIDTKDVITSSDELHVLYAYPADKKTEPFLVQDDPNESIVFLEKLLFAGNQYVSVEEKEVWQNGGLPAEESKVRVRKLSQLNETAIPTPVSGGGGHVTVQDIFGEGAQQILARMNFTADSSVHWGNETFAEVIPVEDGAPFYYNGGDNWAIVRKPGRWTAQVAETIYEPESRVIGYKLHSYPARLPELVTSHDKLSGASWVKDAQLQESRTDLLVSPLEDLAVVMTDKKLALYTPDSSIEQSRLVLEVPLLPGEALVSAQWATGSYVGEWVTKTRKYLQNGQE